MTTEFDEIRPYNDDEIKTVVQELLDDPLFAQEMKKFAPWLPRAVRNMIVRAAFIGVNSTLDFQRRFMVHVLRYVIHRTSRGTSFFYSGIAPGVERYTFMSNHRDIVLDSAILDTLLIEEKFPTSCEIAIGDNLLIHPWIKKLVRLNKSFIVRRGLSRRELLESSQLMSRYIHYAVNEKRENIWIAQREGRAKNGDDRTQESVLKMLAMGGEGSAAESLKHLCIVPLSISYEYDPCDYLKAREFLLKRDNPDFKKSKQDDMDSMRIGIWGKKGRIHYQTAPCINTWLDQLASLPRTEFFSAVAARIDREIHRGYRLYPGNYVAADLFEQTNARSGHYTARNKAKFLAYIEQRIALVDVENKDEDFLRHKLLEMYANPVLNHEKALQ